MPNAFNFSASPFDCLDSAEQALVRSSVDIAYFPEAAVVLDVGDQPTHLFVIIKGHVSEYEGDELIATFGPTDCFDGRALVTGRAGTRCLSFFNRSSPDSPGIRTSEISTCGIGAPRSIKARASLAEAKLRKGSCSRARVFSSTQRIDLSSSTIQTGFIDFSSFVIGMGRL